MILALSLGLSLVATAEPPDDDAAVELREHHRHHHHGGVTQFIAMSLDTLGVDDAKRPRVEKLQDQLHACAAPVREKEHAVLLVIADGVAAGAVDASKVDGAIVELEAAAAGVHACSAATLNELHALLTPPERAAVAEKVEAHWNVWRQVNHEAPVGGREPGGRLSELAKELALTPAQVEQISAASQKAASAKPAALDPAKVHAHVRAFASAFATEAFDAKAIQENANGALDGHGARRMAAFYEAATPLLTPEQRATLAQHLKEHATHQPAVPAP